MSFDIRNITKKEMLVAAHRGACMGNIPCNTIQAYEAALFQGADIIEIDVTKSMDGELFVFHPTCEPIHLGMNVSIEEMSAVQVKPLRYVNYDNKKTQYGISTLDEILDLLKDRCYINIDKFWTDIPGISAKVRAHGVERQVIVKTYVNEAHFKLVEQYAPDLPYMVMMEETDDWSCRLKKRNINYLGAEVFFATENAQVATDEYIDWMHGQDLRVWCNANVCDYQWVVSAGHTDDISVTGHAAEGWGWLARKKYDMMQTDWPGEAIRYLAKSGEKFRQWR